jgi:hypothetical protein
MTIVKQMSLCLEFILPDNTRLCLYQRGFTTHLQWLMECFQTHLKDANGTSRCFYSLMIAIGQWRGIEGNPQVSSRKVAADLTLTFNFVDKMVSGSYGDESFVDMEIVEWLGTPVMDLPFVEEWGAEVLTEDELAELSE